MDENVFSISDYREKRRQHKLEKEAGNVEKKIEKRNRAHTGTFVLMLSVAILFDALAFIPVIGWILGPLSWPFAWLTFYVWTSIKGWGLSDTLKQLVVNWFIPFVEVIPVLNMLPAWTLKVVISYSFLKAEDALYNASGGKADAEKLAEIYKKAA
jgi:hypothetical protein